MTTVKEINKFQRYSGGVRDRGLGDSSDVVGREGKKGIWEDESYGSIFVQEKAFVVLDIDSVLYFSCLQFCY